MASSAFERGRHAVTIRSFGSGPLTVLALHEAGTTGEIWAALGAALGTDATVLAPDRPGWGEGWAPEGYVRTTVAEQAALAASILEQHLAVPAVVCGAGIGAVAALELSLRRPELVVGAVLVEPPLLAFVTEATQQLSADAGTVRDAVSAGGRQAALGAYLAGELLALGAGAERIPESLAERGPAAAASLFAEIAAVPAWEVSDSELASAGRSSIVVVGTDTPPLVARAAEELCRVLGRTDLRELGPGLPHLDQPTALAALVAEVGDASVST